MSVEIAISKRERTNIFILPAFSPSMNRLILAMDLEDRNRAVGLCESIKGEIAAIKVNYPLVLSCGIDIVKNLSVIKPVICDFKVADVPHTNEKIAEIAKANGASAIIVHGFMGEGAIEACSKILKTIVVAEMSSEGSREFFESYSERIIEIAKEASATGLIAPATKPERIKYIRSLAPDLRILCPGVGAQGGRAKDAVENGADYVIVGRSIYESHDPLAAAKEMNKEISMGGR